MNKYMLYTVVLTIFSALIPVCAANRPLEEDEPGEQITLCDNCWEELYALASCCGNSCGCSRADCIESLKLPCFCSAMLGVCCITAICSPCTITIGKCRAQHCPEYTFEQFIADNKKYLSTFICKSRKHSPDQDMLDTE